MKKKLRLSIFVFIIFGASFYQISCTTTDSTDNESLVNDESPADDSSTNVSNSNSSDEVSSSTDSGKTSNDPINLDQETQQAENFGAGAENKDDPFSHLPDSKSTTSASDSGSESPSNSGELSSNQSDLNARLKTENKLDESSKNQSQEGVNADQQLVDANSSLDSMDTQSSLNEQDLSSSNSNGDFSNQSPSKVTGLKFKANESGGTVVIETSSPVNYTTRSNPDTNQLIIELPNTQLPKQYKRKLNTKDMDGSIGSVDAYQNPGNSVARVVIQLRKGSPEPSVQQEGNAILVISNGSSGSSSDVASDVTHQTNSPNEQSSNEVSGSQNDGEEDGPVLQSHSLSEFLTDNTKFYGKKISIETNEMEVTEALKFIMQESGVNMVISEEVKGKVNLKLRQVPWDQALIMIMKTKKLGYSRLGNTLRISPLSDLKQEEEDATRVAKEKRLVEALKVRMYPVNYAKVEDVEKKIKDFLTERGKVVSDPRTNYLVVSDIEESLNRVAKLIASLDIQPQQVLIEGKVIEASEEFTRNIGVSWGLSGQAVNLAKGRNPLSLQPSLDINPLSSSTAAATNLDFSLNLGTLDFLGDLSATLSLAEKEDNLKVISSPRIVTMTNEKANINQKTQIPVKSIMPGGTGQVPLVGFSFKDLLLKLEVTPQITSDGSVIMSVDVVREIAGAPVSAADNTMAINSRQATTKVLVKNGQTAVIGGIYHSDVTEGKDGVPYLKDIPGLGFLFRNSSTRKLKQELLVFLTPRILGQVDSQVIPSETSKEGVSR